MSRTLLCLGYGYTARALARHRALEDWRLLGTARDADKARGLEAEGLGAVLWTDGGIDPAAFEPVNAVLISTPPDENGCPAFAAAAAAIAARAGNISWIGYLSSNGVYGDHKGEWVDEDSPLYPSTARGRARIAAEAAWTAHAAAYALPLIIFRLPGIYGPGRSAIDALRAGRARRIVKQGQVFNRMHVDDIALALAASLADPEAGDLFNLADDLPAPPQDVIAYAAALLGVEPPPLIAIDKADLSEMAASFYAENKRVRNDLMKQALGVRLRYPTYKEGLKAILDASAPLISAKKPG